MKPAKKQAAKPSTIAVVSTAALASADSDEASCTQPTTTTEQIHAEVTAAIHTIAGVGPEVIGIDLASGPDVSVIEFDIERLDVVYRLPVVSLEAETKPAPMTARSITVFKGQDGQNMELVLAWERDLAHQPEGLTLIDPATGMALAAQPFAKDAA